MTASLSLHVLRKRHRKSTRFRWYGRFAIAVACSFLIFLLSSIAINGYHAFFKTEIRMAILIPDKEDISLDDMKMALRNAIKQKFPAIQKASDIRALQLMISKGARSEILNHIKSHPEWRGKREDLWVTASSEMDMGHKHAHFVDKRHRLWYETLNAQQDIRTRFNARFFLSGDSREAELAGILGSMMGSLLIIVVCMLVALPLSVAAAIFLEECTRRSAFIDMIEININNLAAVPSIIYGLIGLSIFINTLHMHRSSAIVGGLTLSLMVLPTMIVTTRQALRTIPLTLRQGVVAMGASPMQVILHHVLPLALPGIMTGMILSVSRAIGETSPLLMIGMVAFIADLPQRFLDPAGALPVQIFLWSDSLERGFVEKTSAAILVLLAILLLLNSVAIYVRKRFEHQW